MKMPFDSPHDDQETRIRKLREHLRLPPDPRPAPDRNPDSEEATLRYLATIDAEPTTTNARQLIEDGIELPPPDSLDPDDVHDKLWEVIHGLARRRTFLQNTDHLTDLELYRKLWEETLNEDSYELDDTMGACASIVDLIGSGSDEDHRLYLTYYADEFDRDLWRQEFPDDDFPEARKPPADRDRHLPKM